MAPPYLSSCRTFYLLRALAPSFATTCLSIAASLAGGCDDPVRQAQLAELGPEDANVALGPLHRPGQPCLLCHEPAGPAVHFTVAGTVFNTPADMQPVGGVQVRLIDAARRPFTAYTNAAGNFFVSPQEYKPVLPLWVSLEGQGRHIDMESPMHKDGDCGFCHREAKSPSSAGHVFLTDTTLPLDAIGTSSHREGKP